MSANTRILFLAPFHKFLVPYWGFFNKGDVAVLSNKGSRGIYVDRFWGQVLRKYLQGTQARPELCFRGFDANGKPTRPLSSTQLSGGIEETGPIFVAVGITVAQPLSPRSCLSHVCCQMSNGHPEPSMW